MKFQMLNEEGNPETFEKIIPSIPMVSITAIQNAAIEQCAQIADQESTRCNLAATNSEIPQMWMARAESTRFITNQIRALLTDPQPQSNKFPLELVISRMADQLEKWSRESRAGGWSTHQCVAMDEKAKELRAAIDNPQPQSPRNITQEQAIIAALVEACKAADQRMSLNNRFPEIRQQLQDALALADTLKKGDNDGRQ